MRLTGAACTLPPQGTCCANTHMWAIWTSIGRPPPELPVQEIQVSCLLGATRFLLSLDLEGLWSVEVGAHRVGTHGWTSQADVTTYDVHWPATLIVEESVGSLAPFPELVTPDFRRVLRLEVDGSPFGVSGFDVSASLRFTLTVAQFHGEPNGTCVVCAQ